MTFTATEHEARFFRQSRLVAGLVCLLVAGCAGYRLGPTNGLIAREKSVYVVPFQNRTMEPRLSEAVTQALRKRLSQEGTFRLAAQPPADVTVSGTLASYQRHALAYRRGDVIAPEDFEVTLTAHVVAETAPGGNRLLDRDVRGRATIRIHPDQSSAERQALPVLAGNLAESITSLLVDGIW
jgi:hypothetical protein